VTIADRLRWEDVAEININAPALPGITAEVGLSRIYPWGADMGHVVPSFDPNMFVRGISVKNWTGLNEDPFRPLAAKAVQGTYPPGSTFKMVTALAALEAGVIDTEETIYCPGFTEVFGTRFHCWKGAGHGNINLHESIKQSCDCYYYEIGQRVGIDKIAEMARKLGLGVKHDLPLSAVASGLAPDKAWKTRVREEDWRIGDTVNASIGQGYVLSSPLQLAVMAARIATGREVTPRLVKSVDGVETPSGLGDSLGINENVLRRIREAMNAVSNHQRGTAYSSRIIADGLQMAGKTGTSQVRRITAEERARGVTRNAENTAAADPQQPPQLHAISHYKRFMMATHHLRPTHHATVAVSQSNKNGSKRADGWNRKQSVLALAWAL